MKEIQPIGSVLETDEEGFIVKQADESKITGKWKESVDLLVKEYLRTGGDIHSIWIRGSVAKGEAIENISDIDSFCITKSDRPDPSVIEDVSKDIRDRFPFITKVEMQFIPYDNLFEEKRFSLRFVIKTQSVCVYGEDISDRIDPFRIDSELAAKLNDDIGKRIERARKVLEQDDPFHNKRICTWVMKRIIRQGLTLVLDKEKVFTRDLYPCCKIFSKYYPEREAEMKTALELAIFPTEDRDKILEVINTLGEWMVSESNRIFVNDVIGV